MSTFSTFDSGHNKFHNNLISSPGYQGHYWNCIAMQAQFFSGQIIEQRFEWAALLAVINSWQMFIMSKCSLPTPRPLTWPYKNVCHLHARIVEHQSTWVFELVCICVCVCLPLNCYNKVSISICKLVLWHKAVIIFECLFLLKLNFGNVSPQGSKGLE